ncbi:MAG TPA: DUF3592 domain-containing protein [Gemmatimonadales bacterium]|jgi:hypothetical protein|nr:DUF3592 domain-containing protein [Gemmatimonadales bacterium]
MAADPPAFRRWYPPFLVVAGFILCLYGSRRLGASYAVTRWPVVPARIVQSTVESVSTGGFRPRISYEFFLAGRRYLASGIERPAGERSRPDRTMPMEQAAAVVARYPVGQELLAGYDPGNLGNAVLHPRFDWWTIAPVLLGAMCNVLGIMIWRHRLRVTETVASP